MHLPHLPHLPLPLLPLLALVLLPACSSSPDTTVVRFHQALAHGDGEKALSFLSDGTRAELQRRAEAAHQASGGAISANPAEMIVQGDDALYPAGAGARDFVRARVVSIDGAQASVEVFLGTTRHEVKLVREHGGWRIVLPLPGEKR